VCFFAQCSPVMHFVIDSDFSVDNNSRIRYCRTMMSQTKRFENQLRKRIALRLSQGWSLEKIGHRTVWTMFGHLYSIKNGALIVKMHGGNETFGPGVAA
jgi:hypothetical protein